MRTHRTIRYRVHPMTKRKNDLMMGTAGACRYVRARLLHQRTSKKIAQARTNWCYQVSRELADKYDVVYIPIIYTMTVQA